MVTHNVTSSVRLEVQEFEPGAFSASLFHDDDEVDEVYVSALACPEVDGLIAMVKTALAESTHDALDTYEALCDVVAAWHDKYPDPV